MARRTCRQSVWTLASARVRLPDTRLDIDSADPFLLRTPGSGWPGDGHGRLGNQGRRGDCKTASATVTATATERLLGVAPPSKPRLGALLSSDQMGGE
jgi:hypothetical protein